MNSGFLIHLSNTFLVSHQRPYPIYNSKRPACHNSIQDHWSGNRENLTTNTKNLPLLLIFNCRCSNRVGKSGNRNKCTGTAPFGKQWINSGTGETAFRTTFAEAVSYYESNDPKGECVLVIEGKSRESILQEERAKWEEMTVQEHMDYYMNQGIDKKEAMKKVAKDRGVGKRDIYKELL